MKKVLLIARAATTQTKGSAERFADRIQTLLTDNVSVENCEISELCFEVGSNGATIYHPEKKFDIRDFDLVVIRHIGSYAVEAHAITLYCQHFGIKYTDTYLNRLLLDNKLSTEFLLWANDVTCWPRTFYGPSHELAARFAELGEKAVLKDNEGSKGRLNFVVKSAYEIRAITAEYPDKHFLLQDFIPNDGDLRVLIFNDKPVLVIRRISDGSTHLNNTSRGGKAELLSLDAVDRRILNTCVRAAQLTKLQVAGVDVVINSETQEFYLLEVNNAPQISSGSFLAEKAVLYADMISDLLREGNHETN